MTRHCECPDTIDPDGRCCRCGLHRDSVTIPRAEYEAYKAAAEALLYIATNDYPTQTMIDCPHDITLEDYVARDALAALRAAGIQTEGGEK